MVLPSDLQQLREEAKTLAQAAHIADMHGEHEQAELIRYVLDDLDERIAGLERDGRTEAARNA